MNATPLTPELYMDLFNRHQTLQATVEALQAVIKQMGEQACVLAKDGMAAKAQVEALQREHSQLQALVRALPVVEGKLEVDRGACYYVRALDGKENPLVCGLIIEQSTAFALKALFEHRATMDATTPTVCPDCNGEGAVDSGGTDPNGNPLMRRCGCREKGGDGE